jgi:cyanophycinase-like exopeptidase
MVRLLDSTHLARVRELHDEFYAAWRPEDRDVVARHREEVRAALSAADCLLVAGGHVAELLHVLHLFHVAPHLPQRVVAWSAGAMALSTRVVLFGDRAAQGPAHSEVYDEGLGVIDGLVLLPHARRRLRTDDLGRMAVLARRFAPLACLVLDDGMRLDLRPDGELPPGARVVDATGRIDLVGRA